MASPTKVVEGIRKRKRDRRLENKQKRLRSEMKREANAAPAELRKFIPGYSNS